jgi:hypothetical protein
VRLHYPLQFGDKQRILHLGFNRIIQMKGCSCGWSASTCTQHGWQSRAEKATQEPRSGTKSQALNLVLWAVLGGWGQEVQAGCTCGALKVFCLPPSPSAKPMGPSESQQVSAGHPLFVLEKL